MTALVVLLVALGPVLVIRPAGFVVLIGLLGYGSWRLARAVFRPATRVDATMLAWTVGLAWVGLAAELLSLARLLGNETAWLAAGGVLALAGAWLPAGASRGCSAGVVRSWAPSIRALVAAVPLVGRLLLAVFALQLGAAFILTWFVGINVGDSVVAYMPRSILMAQEGTVAAGEPSVVFLQYLHEAVVAVQLVFLRSDVLVNVFSFVTAGMASLAIFAFVRSVLPAPERHGWLPLAAALVPFTMPLFLLHASVSNFDVFEGQWLLFAVYFLRRGYSATTPRWLAAAALATGLALATKPTFWFAAPGLGLIWLWTFARPLARRAPPQPLPALMCAAIMLLVGTPFLWRNVLSHGYLIAPAENREAGTGVGGSPIDRVRLLGFNGAALGLALLAPPSLLPAATARELDGRFATWMQATGARLPDPALTQHQSWPELIRHVSHRYDSNHASFGAAFVLLIVPALLLLPFARRWLGPRWPFALAAGLLATSYFVVLGTLSLYNVALIRYLIEMVILLAVLAPLLFLALPRRVRGPLAAVLAVPLLLEMHDVVRNNRLMPPGRVVNTPRMDQFYAFSGDSLTTPEAARAFVQKYPPAEYPDVWVQAGGDSRFPSLTFFGPTLERRLHYWAPTGDSLPPGPFLPSDPALAERLIRAGMVPDRLDGDVWLLLPNDRLRLRFLVLRRDVTAAPVLRLEASIPPDRYRAPLFRYVLLDGGETISLREFSPDATFELPVEQARRGAIRVEVRDGERGRTAERAQIDRNTLRGL